jgi:hypothetical protein
MSLAFKVFGVARLKYLMLHLGKGDRRVSMLIPLRPTGNPKISFQLTFGKQTATLFLSASRL